MGKTYVASAQALSTAFGTEPGITFMAEDFVEADLLMFHTYATALLDRVRRADGHDVLLPLIDAVLLPSLVMLERAGRPVDLGADVARQAKVIALRRMPR